MATKYRNLTISCWIYGLIAALNITISLANVQNKHDHLRPKPKGTIKTIECPEDGTVIDCVDIYKQPAAFDKNNKPIKDLQIKPPSHLLIKEVKENYGNIPKLYHPWHKYGECPNGTVPIRRIPKNNPVPRKQPITKNSVHEYAIADQPDATYHGSFAVFNTWEPRVYGKNEFSLSQTWACSNKHHSPQTDLNCVEAGWIVYPNKYGDAEPRIFTYWTSDNYRSTGCYDTECGFFQTNDKYIPGDILRPVSAYGGPTYDIIISLQRDNITGHWWLQVHDVHIGYFPKSLFSTLGDGADDVQWGGEIVNLRSGGRHTRTQMGSGHFPHEGYGKSSYVRDLSVTVRYGHEYFRVDANPTPHVSEPTCYDLTMGPNGTSYNVHFYYGGPGYSAQCP